MNYKTDPHAAALLALLAELLKKETAIHSA